MLRVSFEKIDKDLKLMLRVSFEEL